MKLIIMASIFTLGLLTFCKQDKVEYSDWADLDKRAYIIDKIINKLSGESNLTKKGVEEILGSPDYIRDKNGSSVDFASIDTSSKFMLIYNCPDKKGAFTNTFTSLRVEVNGAGRVIEVWKI